MIRWMHVLGFFFLLYETVYEHVDVYHRSQKIQVADFIILLPLSLYWIIRISRENRITFLFEIHRYSFFPPLSSTRHHILIINSIFFRMNEGLEITIEMINRFFSNLSLFQSNGNDPIKHFFMHLPEFQLFAQCSFFLVVVVKTDNLVYLID